MHTVEDVAAIVFLPAWFGYRKDEVEALRSRLVSTLLEADKGRFEGLAVGAGDLAEASFTRAMRGYARESVDSFFRAGADLLEARGIPVGHGHRWVTATELRQLRFSLQVDGYSPAAVTRFLKVAAETLESRAAGEPARLTLRQLDRTELSLRFMGYRCDEVETVLERVAATLAYHDGVDSPVAGGPGREDPQER